SRSIRGLVSVTGGRWSSAARRLLVGLAESVVPGRRSYQGARITFGGGARAPSSLVIGALLGMARDWPPRLVGLVLAFGAGALISAVSFDLAEEGARL